MWGEVSSRIDILTKCKRKSVRVDYFGRMYVSLPNTQEKKQQLFSRQTDVGKWPFILAKLIHRNSWFAGCLGDSIRLR